MTSIEWLYAELAKNNNSNDSIKERISRQAQIWKDAKEMHKQQIIDAWNDVYGNIKDAEQYYQETFGSNGSGMSEKPNNHTNSEKPNNHTDAQLPQQEISDEEIYEGIIKHCSIPHDRLSAEINAMIGGAKWYREQLKQKL